MRTLFGFAFLLCGCQLLPSTKVACETSDRCPDVVTSPFVFGQPDDKTNWLLRGQESPEGVAIVAGKLLVADTQHNRVLGWNAFPTTNNQPFDFALGQTQTSTIFSYYYTGNVAVFKPARMTSDGTRLIVAADDAQGYGRPNYNTLEFYSSFPSATPTSHDDEIDAVSVTAAAANNFKGASPLLVGSRLALGDREFNRVLLWNPVPTSPTAANVVLGQSNFTNANPNGGGAVSGSGLNKPEGTLSSNGTNLIVPDTQNHRVLMWDTIPTANGQAASRVLGQANATSGAANRGGAPSLGTLNEPSGTATAMGRLVVADRGNHRVLLWNSLPTGATNGQAASLALGQELASGNTANPGGVSAKTMNHPTGVATDGIRVAVADTDNHRVLLWQSWPTMPGQPADNVLGQSTFGQNPLEGRIPARDRLVEPVGLTSVGNRLVVVDRNAHRALIWSRLPLAQNEQPELVLGQPDFDSGQPGTSGGSGLDTPNGASSDGTSLYIADSGNHRVLIWKTLPTQNQQPPDLVLGQPSLSSTASNSGGTAAGLNFPQDVFVRNGRVYVADRGNHRVLIWKTLPTQNQQPPDLVLGQDSLSGKSANLGSTTNNRGFDSPNAVCADDSHIYVSDYDNSRVLVWNTLEPANGQAADLVLGQPNFSAHTPISPASASTIGFPSGVSSWNGSFYISDFEHDRIMVFNRLPDQIGQSADAVIAQPTFSSGVGNFGGLSATSLQGPSGLLFTEVGLYISDTRNGRLVVLPPR